MQNLQVLVTNVVLTAVKDGGIRYPGSLKF